MCVGVGACVDACAFAYKEDEGGLLCSTHPGESESKSESESEVESPSL